MKELYVFFLSMMPVGEVRLSIPMGIFYYHLSPMTSYLVSVVGNIVIAIVLLYMLQWFEKWIRKVASVDKLYTRYVDALREKVRYKLSRWGYIVLLLFVGVPLPGSGVYTGALVSYLFSMEKLKSIVYISLGAVMASTIVVYLSVATKVFIK